MLETVALFSGLDKEELDIIRQCAVTRAFPKNSILFNEGDQSDSLYIVVSGRVKVFLGDDDGKEIDINFHGPGEYFGELALFEDLPRSASVITTEKSKFIILSKTDFLNCLDRHPAISLSVIRELSKRLRELTDNVRSLALMDVYGRVARLLLKLSEPAGGGRVIHQKLTQQDIADQVGSSREMISRILKDLKAGGYIQIEAKQIRLVEKLPAAW